MSVTGLKYDVNVIPIASVRPDGMTRDNLRNADETASVSGRVPLSSKTRLNEIAFEESNPAHRVTVSGLVRLAVLDFLEDYERDDVQIQRPSAGVLTTSRQIADVEGSD